MTTPTSGPDAKTLRAEGEPVLSISMGFDSDVVYRMGRQYYGHDGAKDRILGPFESLAETAAAMNLTITGISMRVSCSEWTPFQLLRHVRVMPEARGKAIWFNDAGWQVPADHPSYSAPVSVADIRRLLAILAANAEHTAESLRESRSNGLAAGMANKDAIELRRLARALDGAAPGDVAPLLDRLVLHGYLARQQVGLLRAQIRAGGVR